MAKEKFIVLDTEGMSGKIPYNIGFIVANRYGKIYKRHSFALPENIYINICQSAKTQQAVEMTAKNVQEILKDFGNSRLKRKYKCVSNVYIVNFILKLIKKYKIKKIYAYNVTFDKMELKNLFFSNNFDIINGKKLLKKLESVNCLRIFLVISFL